MQTDTLVRTEDRELKRRQLAGEKVREKMVTMLLNYSPVRDLKVADVHVIAEMAQSLAFSAMMEVTTTHID